MLLIGTQVALEVNQEVALVRRRDQRRDRLADQLGGRVPEERLHPRVDGLQPTAVVQRHDAVGNVVQDASDVRAAGAQGVLCRNLVSDIARHAVTQTFLRNRCHGPLQPPVTPILALEPRPKFQAFRTLPEPLDLYVNRLPVIRMVEIDGGLRHQLGASESGRLLPGCVEDFEVTVTGDAEEVDRKVEQALTVVAARLPGGQRL